MYLRNAPHVLGSRSVLFLESATNPEKELQMTDVTVKKGSNLSQIVQTYNKAHNTHLTVAQAAKENGIKNANLIQAGAKLHFKDGFDSKTQPKQPTKPKTATKFEQPKTSSSSTTDKTTQVFTKMMKDLHDKSVASNPFGYSPDFSTKPFAIK
jgi:hypothetical protein